MKILVLYYSMTGNTYRMANLVAEGARQAGAEVDIKTVPELVPDEVVQADESARKAKQEQADVPIAKPDELADYHAIIVGTPTRFGNMCSQMRNFWDQTGGLWMKGALIGKPAAVFCSTASMHGGQETTLIATMMTFFHHGMIIVGVPYSVQQLVTTNSGGTPYGPTHVSGHPPTNPITDDETAICRALGRGVAEVAQKLAA
ncbi:MAG: NAD(P)H:quinone oxidoreductase [Armatimonadota bacterium]|nr:MAG: NAD(P)H:quinone oxidoreductase [Armatimonadota bacterium]